MVKTMIVILKSGVRFEHRPAIDTEEAWEDFMMEAASNIGRRNRPGVLVVHNPTAVYDAQEVAAIQFGDIPKPREAMGFRSRE